MTLCPNFSILWRGRFSFLSLLVLSVLVWCASASPSMAAQNPLPPETVAYLESLVGKYPASRILNDPRLKPLLLATLGQRRFAQLLRGWGRTIDNVVVSPITKQQDAIVITACKPHDCGAFNATIHVNLKDGTVQACWHAAEGEPNLDQWLTPGEAKALGVDACNR